MSAILQVGQTLSLPNEEASDSPMSFKDERDRLLFTFHSAVPLKLAHYRNYEAAASTGQVWLEGGSSSSDGKEVLARQVPLGPSAATLGKTSVSEGSFVCFVLISCGCGFWS